MVNPFVDKRVGVQVKLCNLSTMRVIPERLCSEALYQVYDLYLYLYNEVERDWPVLVFCQHLCIVRDVTTDRRAESQTQHAPRKHNVSGAYLQ